MTFDPTPGALRVILNRCGLSQSEAAAWLGVEVRTVGRWVQGALTPSGAPYRPSAERWARLLDLCARQDRAADEAVALIARKRWGGIAPSVIVLRMAADDADAKRLGWPTRSAHVALLRRVAERLEAAGLAYAITGDDDPAAAAAKAAHVRP